MQEAIAKREANYAEFEKDIDPETLE